MESSKDVSSKLAAGLGTAVGVGAALVGAGIVYSLTQVDHNMVLPPAVDIQRTVFTSPKAGYLSYYGDLRSGMEGARPLVLLHSINGAASVFEVRPLFERYYGWRPVYAMDMPGFGFSERGDRVYTADLYVSAIVDLLAREVGEAADVVALSLSCEFAARAALARPELFHSLTCISPTGLNATDIDVNEDLLYGLFTFPLWSQALYDLIVTRTSIHYFLQKNFVERVPEPMIDYAYLTAHQPGARYAPFSFVSGKLFTKGVRTAVYEKLSVPVLVLYDEDPNISFDKLPDLLAKNPNWQAVRISPTLGLPHWEKLGATTEALEAFWTSIA